MVWPDSSVFMIYSTCKTAVLEHLPTNWAMGTEEMDGKQKWSNLCRVKPLLSDQL